MRRARSRSTSTTRRRVHGRQHSRCSTPITTTCFLPIHVYDTARADRRVILRRKVPSGVEVRRSAPLVRRFAGAGRHALTSGATATTPARGDGLLRPQQRRLHLRPDGNKRSPKSTISDASARTSARQQGSCALRRDHACAALGSRAARGRRIEATEQGLDIRYLVTSCASAPPNGSTTALLRARPSRNLIKLHKSQLASDRPAAARRSPIRFASSSTRRYWLLLTVRDPFQARDLAGAEFIRLGSASNSLLVSSRRRRVRSLRRSLSEADLFRGLSMH